MGGESVIAITYCLIYNLWCVNLYMYTVFIGYNGGYGSAGLGLGSRYGNGGMKGPKPGSILTVKIIYP